MGVRVTQLPVEVLRSGGGKTRVTQIPVEVLRSGGGKVRATQLVAEVLRGPSVFPVSSTTTMTLTATASATGGTQPKIFNVTANTSFILSELAYEYTPKRINVSASNAVVLTPTGVCHVPTPYPVSATTAFTLTPSAKEYVPVSRAVSALSSVVLTPTDKGFVVGKKPVSALSSIIVSPSNQGLVIGFKPVAGRSAILLAVSDSNYVTGIKYASATGSLVIGESALALDAKPPRVLPVSASTIIYLWPYSSCYASPIRVAAASSIVFSLDAEELTIGGKPVSSVSSFTLSTVPSYIHNSTFLVSASSGLTLSPSLSAIAIHVLSAHTAFTMTPKATGFRAVFATATTNISMSYTPKTNQFNRPAATNSVIFASAAQVAKTGTLASSGFVFTDRAQAVVWLPWRPGGLSAPPGGGLPHS